MSEDSSRPGPTPEWAQQTEQIRKDEREFTRLWDEVEALARQVSFLRMEVKDAVTRSDGKLDRLLEATTRTNQSLDYVSHRTDAVLNRVFEVEGRVSGVEQRVSTIEETTVIPIAAKRKGKKK